MTASLTLLYAGLNGLIALALAYYVVRGRIEYRVSLGSAGNADLERRVRAHANNIEYVPLALVLMLAIEINGAPAWFVHALGIVLTVSRAVHGWGLSRTARSLGRRIGTTGTWAMLAAAIVFALGRGAGLV